ncbi:peptidase M15 [Bradyrhizobium sp. LHD-71]|uniref:peptidase M15 n=1 Tax=Bradyrhizobium sp. LHD-71 TaxID=3072141 RepID=UPI00280EC576|nr:peptidase M15 [Bradyrhizobium sp. LHD-71]MDQ8732437.1 peptidase M15 [Bradyrhizobium sp. LHD-71]
MAQLEPLGAIGMMNPQRFPTSAATSCVLVGLVAASLAGFNSADITTVKPIEERHAASVAADAERVDTPPAPAMGSTVVASADATAVPELVTAPAIDATADSDKPGSIAIAALPETSQILPPESPPVEMAPASTPDPVPDDDERGDEAVSAIELLDECFVLDVCVDHYLWALYQRTAKVDTRKEFEWRKVKVKKKRKTVTVSRRFTRLVEEDFTWKDPKAAEKAGMPMMDYVIGGMDPRFKLKLFHVLRAAEKAGLAPGITSGFRDDYRQSIASGMKAASNRSFHGGSLRGGYGKGVAADVVSVKGATKGQRWLSTVALWEWIDANELQFGIGRPYLHKDPPHVAPIDGKEYASRRGAKTQTAEADAKKPAAQPDRSVAKTNNRNINIVGAERLR